MIELKNIYKKFGSKLVVNNASCNFEDKKVTVVLGPSGSGKTTLVRCTNFLESPSDGEVFYSGKKVTKHNIYNIRKKIGVVFQNFNLFPHMNVLDNIIYAPSKLIRKSKNTLINDAREITSQLGIDDKLEFMPSKLSGGQKQRVAIARCLIMKPEVVIFDEPTSALDPESIKDVVSVIEDIKKDLTIIAVTHHLSFAQKIADKVIFMDQGHILCDQKADKFFEEPDSFRAKIFLEAVSDYM